MLALECCPLAKLGSCSLDSGQPVTVCCQEVPSTCQAPTAGAHPWQLDPGVRILKRTRGQAPEATVSLLSFIGQKSHQPAESRRVRLGTPPIMGSGQLTLATLENTVLCKLSCLVAPGGGCMHGFLILGPELLDSWYISPHLELSAQSQG